MKTKTGDTFYPRLYTSRNLRPISRRSKNSPARIPSSDKIAHLRGAERGGVDERIIAKRYFVSGIVQGVGFRYFGEGAARKAGVAGYVRNLFDGRVEAYAIGTKDQLKEFRSMLERGPGAASVAGVAEEEAAIQEKYAEGFSIEYDA